jgi:hypothetical protein
MSGNVSVAGAISAFPTEEDENDQLILTRGTLNRIIQEALDGLRVELDLFREEVARERSYDRKRLAALEKEPPQKAQIDRGEVLKALIMANGGKMFAKDARQQMRLPKNVFSMLLRSQKDVISIRHYHLDRRRIVLELL